MSQDLSSTELVAQLREVEKDLENLRRTAASVRASVGDEDDAADRGALIQQADDLDGQVEELVARRDELKEKLGL
jgi:ribosomal protein L29